MGKSNVALPDLPPAWNDTPGETLDGWLDFTLPDGQKLKEVIQQQRTDLQSAVDRAQSGPDSPDGGLGYAAGHYLAMARPHEIAVHVRGAIANGVSKEELSELMLHSIIYCGIPKAVEGFRTAAGVLKDMGLE